MAYIDKNFYDNEFMGISIPGENFSRIADIASSVIYDICLVKPDVLTETRLEFKKAVCYQTELIFKQGGVDAILGFSEASNDTMSESLGDYSYSATASKDTKLRTRDGVPVSSLSLMILRKLGLMNRWVYKEAYERRYSCNEKQNS